MATIKRKEKQEEIQHMRFQLADILVYQYKRILKKK